MLWASASTSGSGYWAASARRTRAGEAALSRPVRPRRRRRRGAGGRRSSRAAGPSGDGAGGAEARSSPASAAAASALAGADGRRPAVSASRRDGPAAAAFSFRRSACRRRRRFRGGRRTRRCGHGALRARVAAQRSSPQAAASGCRGPRLAASLNRLASALALMAALGRRRSAAALGSVQTWRARPRLLRTIVGHGKAFPVAAGDEARSRFGHNRSLRVRDATKTFGRKECLR